MNLTATPAIQRYNHLTVIRLDSVKLKDIVKEKLLSTLEQAPHSLLKSLYNPVEQATLEQALIYFKGNQLKTAKALGINRNTLKKKMDFYGVNLEIILSSFEKPTLSKNEVFATSSLYLPLFELAQHKVRSLAEKKDFYENQPLKSICYPIEKTIITTCLEYFKGNQLKTAKALGINRNTLKKKLDEIKELKDD